jgi:hypothetical protein
MLTTHGLSAIIPAAAQSVHAAEGILMDIRRTVRLLALALIGLGASAAHAAADGSQLALPPGATVAIVVFEDLQCPDCARAHPGLVAASEASKVPLVIHDFPITRHAWAFPAAVLARYFTSQSPALGIEFRNFVFENQKDITPDNLRQFGERFAHQHQLQYTHSTLQEPPRPITFFVVMSASSAT